MAHSTLAAAGLLGLLGMAACAESEPLAWKLPADAASLVYGWPVRAEAPRLVAQAATDPLPIVHLRDEPLYAVTFKESLEALALPSGPFREQNGRDWPAEVTAMIFRPGSEGFVAISLQELRDGLGERVLPVLDSAQCTVMEGCYAYLQAGPAVCEVPCRRPPQPQAPDPPMAPAVPVTAPCADGWSPREVASVTVCDPPSPAACPSGFRRGWATNCLPLGEPCPAGPFPVLSGPVYYVSAGGPAGDGSAGSPFNGMAAALAAVPEGATLALGEGRFEVGLTTTASVTVVGLCASRTTLIAPPQVPVLTLGPGASVQLRNLSCEVGADVPALASEGALRLDGVELRGGSHGVAARGGSVEGGDLRVLGANVEALSLEGARVRLEGVEVSGTGGLHLLGTVPARLSDYWSEASQGLVLEDGAQLTLRRAVIRGHQGWAIRGGLGVALTTEDLYLDGGGGSYGIWLARGARFAGDRLHLVATSSAALRLGPSVDDQLRLLDGVGDLRDSVIEQARHRGVVAVDVKLHTARTLSKAGTGIAFDVPFGESTLEDLTVLDIADDVVIGFGSAVIADRAKLQVSRARIEGFRWHAIRVFSDFGRIGEATLEDVAIASGGLFGVVTTVPALNFRRVSVRGCLAGIGISSDGEWTPIGQYSDLSIRDVMTAGISFYTGQATVNRLFVERSQAAAIALDQVTVSGSDFRVESIPLDPSGQVAFQGNGLSVGTALVKGDLEFAAIDLDRFFFRGTGRAGVWLGANAEASLANGWIEDFQVGVLTSKPDYRRDQALMGVRFAQPQGQ